jgi:hypothetical protein
MAYQPHALALEITEMKTSRNSPALRISRGDVFRNFVRYRYTKRRQTWWKRIVRITMLTNLMKYLLRHRRHLLHRCHQRVEAGSAKQLSASARRGKDCLLCRNKMKNVIVECLMRCC